MNSPDPSHSGLQQRARNALLELFPNAEAGYLFGSAARGAARADSDIDLAILCDLPISPERRFEAARALSLTLDADIDLVDLSSASTVLRCEVITRGVRLFERDRNRALDFEAQVLSEYGALLDATRALRESMRDRLASPPL